MIRCDSRSHGIYACSQYIHVRARVETACNRYQRCLQGIILRRIPASQSVRIYCYLGARLACGFVTKCPRFLPASGGEIDRIARGDMMRPGVAAPPGEHDPDNPGLYNTIREPLHVVCHRHLLPLPIGGFEQRWVDVERGFPDWTHCGVSHLR